MFIIQGRVLPTMEPYCRASFLIKIKLPREYPFKIPEVIILDPIYHPNVVEGVHHKCYCNEHRLHIQQYSPSTPLKHYIEAAIHAISIFPKFEQSINAEVAKEYRDNPQRFYEKALRLTLSYRRPRE